MNHLRAMWRQAASSITYRVEHRRDPDGNLLSEGYVPKNGSLIPPVADIIALRTEIRRAEFFPEFDKWDSGGCNTVSEELHMKYGWAMDAGCYHTPNGKHIAHVWNVLPDGRILDATADQFGEGDNVRITSGGDPRYLGGTDPVCPQEGRDG